MRRCSVFGYIIAVGLTRRQFFAASAAGAGLCSAQQSHRTAKTTRLFKSPEGFPNALALAPEGLWIGEQKLSGSQADQYHLPEPTSLEEHAWLVDWKGRVLKTVTTPSRNTSGMAFGGGYIWMCANAPPEGVFQVDLNSRLISHRQIPLGPSDNGGGCHGAMWHDGKLWIAALRLRAIVRIDPSSWEPEFLIPFYTAPDRNRYHAIAWDNGSIWQVVGNDCNKYADYRPALVRYDAATGRVLETVDFAPGSCDPHGLIMRDGALYSCDAGIHPNWPNNDSPSAGWIFRIDLVG